MHRRDGGRESGGRQGMATGEGGKQGGRHGGRQPEGGRGRVNIKTQIPKFVDFLSTRPVRVAHIGNALHVCEGRQVFRQVVSQGKKYGCRDQEASKDVCRKTGRKATGGENVKIRGLFECTRVCCRAWFVSSIWAILS